MEKHIKVIAMLMALLMVLGACSKQENPSENYFESKNERNLSTDLETAEIFHPITGRTAWLDGGRTFAVQEGFLVRYLDMESKEAREIELSAEGLSGLLDCVFANYGIFMGDFPERHSGKIPKTSLCYINGKWELCGGIFFDREGNVIRKLPGIREMISGEKEYIGNLSAENFGESVVPVERMLWLSEETAAFFSGNHLFLYDISTGEAKLAKGIAENIFPFFGISGGTEA